MWGAGSWSRETESRRQHGTGGYLNDTHPAPEHKVRSSCLYASYLKPRTAPRRLRRGVHAVIPTLSSSLWRPSPSQLASSRCLAGVSPIVTALRLGGSHPYPPLTRCRAGLQSVPRPTALCQRTHRRPMKVRARRRGQWQSWYDGPALLCQPCCEQRRRLSSCAA